MKLVGKLTVMLIVGTSAVLAANGYRRVEREVDLFESDRSRNDRRMAVALASAVHAVWEANGKESALAMIEQLKVPASTLRFDWLSSSDAATRGIRAGTDAPYERASERCTYAEVANPAEHGVIGVCESLEPQKQYVRQTIIETVSTTCMLAAVCALITTVLGMWLVGRPIAALAEKARRIGEGDFSKPLELRRDDEMGSLALEMNAMCDRLTLATARVEAETASRLAAIEQVRHADRLMTVGKLAAGIAHELGTPLNVIEARAEMIATGESTNDEAKGDAGVIVDASARMTRVLRQLLDFARPARASTSREDLAALANTIVDLLRPLASKRHVNVRVLAPEPTFASIDREQIGQVLTNLVVNAIHAMASPGTVEVAVSSEGDHARIRVRDEGTGIAKEHIPHVFEPFFTTKDVGEGTGLGLAVAHGIVRDHGGSIDVKSGLGEGTEFIVLLPKGET